MQKWEYLRVWLYGDFAYQATGKCLGGTVSLPSGGGQLSEAGYPLIDDYLASLGKEGWELVTSLRREGRPGDQLFFKRPEA